VAAGDVELENRWAAWLLGRNRRGMRGVLWIVISLYPLFGVLDYLIAPRQWLWLLYGTRASVTLVTLAMFRVSGGSSFERHANAWSAAYMVLISFGISLMTVFMGGLASPYYAGLSLTIVATGLLFVWPPRVVILTHATIVASFLIPNLVIQSGANLLTAISNQFFLISTAIIAGTGQILAYRSQREQIENQLIIEQTKKNLQSAHDQLKQLDKFKSEFFANITHELKTPLTMMLAPLELLIDNQLGRVSEAQRSTFQSMQRSGMKLLRLIGDLLDLSKLEESRLRLRIEEHDLVAYLRGLVAQVEPLAQRKSITLSFESDVEQALVWCDIERIERVFINLLSNATKFTPAAGSVGVHLRDEGASLRVEVQDTGAGFPSELSREIFLRFFQADMAGTRKFGGAGIGLSLAKELVELHGGSIWASSQAGSGATFSVRLIKDREHFSSDVLDRRGPHVDRADGQRASDRGLAEWQVHALDRFRLIDIDEATEQRVIERDADEDRRRYSVLVVEDTPDVARMVRLALHHEFRVLAAANGRRGLELALKHQPTVIVTDLMMPEMDGLELTRRLRADPSTKHVPIVMLTARGDVQDRITGLEGGVNAYLAKPFSTRELVSTVRSLLSSQEATADILLTQKMDSLETIAGGLAHEILNPLNYVKNAVETIQRDAAVLLEHVGNQATDPGAIDLPTARMQRMFDVAQSGVRRIGATVDLMVRYSREGYSRMTQPYDAFAAVRDVVDVVVPTVGHTVNVTLELQGNGFIECVPEEFNQVLTNLIQNAAEAVPADGSGRLQIRGWNEGRTLVLAIEDNGPGIAPERQARVFEAFYTTKDVGRGMGLGLTITRRVITALGGTITLRSQPGVGSEFTIRVPWGVRREEAARETTAKARRAGDEVSSA
jgi:signal transduction histidine kinase